MTTINPDRLAQLDTITLDSGAHDSFEDGHCAMEVVSWLAEEGLTDAPACVSRTLRIFTISLNDNWDDETRQKLIPYLPRMVGTRRDGQDGERSLLALDWVARTYTPAWLDLAGLPVQADALRNMNPIIDKGAREARPVLQLVKRVATDRALAILVAGECSDPTSAEDAAIYVRCVSAYEAASSAAQSFGGIGLATYSVVRDAAVAAIRAASCLAYDNFEHTTRYLQDSALDLLDRMIDPSKVGE